MIPLEHQASVLAAAKAGRYSLLLGAGFSVTSLGPDGQRLPDGAAFAKELAKSSGHPEYPLAQLTLAMDAAQLAQHLIHRFKGCKASQGIRSVARFVWQHIFTFNVDDVLDDCYASADAQQRLKNTTFRDNYFRPDDLRELPAVYLHGFVNEPSHGFVFSAEQYGASMAEESRWFKIFADVITSEPLMVVGCSLSEPDVFYHLKRRVGLPPGQQLAPSLYISRDIDSVKQKLCEKLGLIPVAATADSFFEELLRLTGKPPSPSEIVLPAKTDLFAAAPPENVQRVFFRQWLLVEPGNLPHLAGGGAAEPHLLSGVEPRWQQVERGDDVIRALTSSIVQEVEAWQSASTTAPQLRLVLSPPGEGKTSFLMRVAYELARLGVLVFCYNVRERISVRDLVAVLVALRKPAVLILDHLGDHGTQFEEVLEQLRAKSVPCFAVCAERQQRMRRVTDVIPLETISQMPLPVLSRQEGEALITKMRQAGLLGQNAKRPTAELVPRITGRELLTSVVLLNSGAKQLSVAVKSELVDLSPDARRMYILAALAHMCEYPIRSSILIRSSGFEASRAFKVLLGELKGLVRPVPPMGDYYETRHSVIAAEVVRHVPDDELLLIFVAMARALAPYVNTKTYSRGTEEARLAARLLDFDSIVQPLLGKNAESLYEQIREQWAWNNRYWTQLALLKLSSDPLLSLQYAEHAVGIENHYVAQTTRAKILFRLARTHAGTSHGSKYLADALSAVEQSLRLGQKVKRANLQTLDVAIRGTLEYYEAPTGGAISVDSSVATRVREYFRQAEGLFLAAEQKILLMRWQTLQNPESLGVKNNKQAANPLPARPNGRGGGRRKGRP